MYRLFTRKLNTSGFNAAGSLEKLHLTQISPFQRSYCFRFFTLLEWGVLGFFLVAVCFCCSVWPGWVLWWIPWSCGSDKKWFQPAFAFLLMCFLCLCPCRGENLCSQIVNPLFCIWHNNWIKITGNKWQNMHVLILLWFNNSTVINLTRNVSTKLLLQRVRKLWIIILMQGQFWENVALIALHSIVIIYVLYTSNTVNASREQTWFSFVLFIFHVTEAQIVLYKFVTRNINTCPTHLSFKTHSRDYNFYLLS